MPIRPIDIVKTQDASQYRQAQLQRAQHEQVQINKSFHDLVEKETSTPVETSKSDYKEFRYDPKEESRNTYSGDGGKRKKDRNKGKDDDGSNDNNKSDGSGGIDILV